MLNTLKLSSVIIFIVFYCSGFTEGKDYYDLLRISRGATDAQIKRAYRKLALQHHPDKVQGNEDEKKAAANKLAEINHAYEVLSDEKKRRIYDQHGEEGLKQQEQQQRGGGGGHGNIFDMFFGGGGGFGQGGEEEEQVKRGHDVIVDLYVTLRDLYVGKEFQVVRDKDVIKPASGTRKCNCKQRLVTRQVGPGMFQQYTQQECEDCPNVKLVREQETMTIRVEPGMRDGEEISKFEEGEPLIDGEPGDLKFFVRTLPDAVFTRDGHNLWLSKTITLLEALTGFKHEMEHLDGHTFAIESAGVTKPGDVKVISGEGMPAHNNEHMHGDLLVTFTVAFPNALTEAQKQGVRQLFSS